MDEKAELKQDTSDFGNASDDEDVDSNDDVDLVDHRDREPIENVEKARKLTEFETGSGTDNEGSNKNFGENQNERDAHGSRPNRPTTQMEATKLKNATFAKIYKKRKLLRSVSIPRCYHGPAFDKRYFKYSICIHPIRLGDISNPGLQALIMIADSVFFTQEAQSHYRRLMLYTNLKMRRLMRTVFCFTVSGPHLRFEIERRTSLKRTNGTGKALPGTFTEVLNTALDSNFRYSLTQAVKGLTVKKEVNVVFKKMNTDTGHTSANENSAAEKDGKKRSLFLKNLPREAGKIFLKIFFPQCLDIGVAKVSDNVRTAVFQMRNKAEALQQLACFTDLKMNNRNIEMSLMEMHEDEKLTQIQDQSKKAIRKFQAQKKKKGKALKLLKKIKSKAERSSTSTSLRPVQKPTQSSAAASQSVALKRNQWSAPQAQMGRQFEQVKCWEPEMAYKKYKHEVETQGNWERMKMGNLLELERQRLERLQEMDMELLLKRQRELEILRMEQMRKEEILQQERQGYRVQEIEEEHQMQTRDRALRMERGINHNREQWGKVCQRQGEQLQKRGRPGRRDDDRDQTPAKKRCFSSTTSSWLESENWFHQSTSRRHNDSPENFFSRDKTDLFDDSFGHGRRDSFRSSFSCDKRNSCENSFSRDRDFCENSFGLDGRDRFEDSFSHDMREFCENSFGHDRRDRFEDSFSRDRREFCENSFGPDDRRDRFEDSFSHDRGDFCENSFGHDRRDRFEDSFSHSKKEERLDPRSLRRSGTGVGNGQGLLGSPPHTASRVDEQREVLEHSLAVLGKIQRDPSGASRNLSQLGSSLATITSSSKGDLLSERCTNRFQETYVHKQQKHEKHDQRGKVIPQHTLYNAFPDTFSKDTSTSERRQQNYRAPCKEFEKITGNHSTHPSSQHSQFQQQRSNQPLLGKGWPEHTSTQRDRHDEQPFERVGHLNQSSFGRQGLFRKSFERNNHTGPSSFGNECMEEHQSYGRSDHLNHFSFKSDNHTDIASFGRDPSDDLSFGNEYMQQSVYGRDSHEDITTFRREGPRDHRHAFSSPGLRGYDNHDQGASHEEVTNYSYGYDSYDGTQYYF